MPTKYLVLRAVKHEGQRAYVVVSEELEADGGEQAIRRAADGLVEEGKTESFAAAPLYNWTEQPVTLEKPPARLKIGGQMTIDPPPEEEEPPDGND